MGEWRWYMVALCCLLLGLSVLVGLASGLVPGAGPLWRWCVARWRWCVDHPYHLLVACLLAFLILNMVGFVEHGKAIRGYRKGEARLYYRIEGVAWLFVAVDQMKYFFLLGWTVVVGIVAWTRHEGRK